MKKTVYNFDKNNVFYEKKNVINSCVREDMNNFVKKINKRFIKKCQKKLSIFLNMNIKLELYTTKVGLDLEKNNSTKSLMCLNTIDINTSKNKWYIYFSKNMLSLIIDFLFGGSGRNTDNANKNIYMNTSESFINQKLIKLIIECYSDVCKTLSSISIKCFFVVLSSEMQKKFFNTDKVLIFNVFKLTMKNLDFFLNVVIPISFFQKLYKKQNFLTISNSQNNEKKSITRNISITDLYEVKLDIIATLIDFSLSHDTLTKMSVGDVFVMNHPEKIIAYIENKPVFSGKYTVFGKKSSISIDHFIYDDLDSKKNQENVNE